YLQREQRLQEEKSAAAPTGLLAAAQPQRPAAEAPQQQLAGRSVDGAQAVKQSESLQSNRDKGKAEIPVVAAGEPIVVTIPSELANTALTAEAICRGVAVANTAIPENKESAEYFQKKGGEQAGRQFSLA